MERKEILEQVIQVVGETLDVADGVELTEDTNLKELGADSCLLYTSPSPRDCS